MPPVKLDGALLRALIRARYKRVADLLRLWEAYGGLHRSTLYRWTRGALPQSRQDMLRLAAALDTDPFSLLEPYGKDAAAAANQLIYAFQNDHWTPAVSFLREFMGRRIDWPPRQLAADINGREWIYREFEHDSTIRRNYYARIEILGSLQCSDERPQVFHFAYRHPVLFGKRWLQYGFVVRHRLRVRLTHISGFSSGYAAGAFADPSRVDTYFGEGDAVFRIASLHPFTIRVSEASRASSRAVRFPA